MELIKVAALLDEFEKIADPFITSAAVSGAFGAYKGLRHGPWLDGKSIDETKSERDVAKSQKVLSKLRPGTATHEIVRDRLKSDLEKHQDNVSSAESAGTGLISAGIQGLGILGTRALVKHIVESEKGTTNEATFRKLVKYMKPSVQPSLVEGDIRNAVTIPKGGALPGFMHSIENSAYQEKLGPILRKHIPAGIDVSTKEGKEIAGKAMRDMVDNMMRVGTVIAPAGAGPHVAAHELGHDAFSKLPLGNLIRKSRIPVAVAGMMGGAYMAGKDPDSTAAKWSPAMGALSVAPIMGEELYATVKGLKALKAIGASPALMSVGRKQLAKAYGSYAALLAAPAILAPYAIRKYRQYQIGRRQKSGFDTSRSIGNRIKDLENVGGKRG